MFIAAACILLFYVLGLALILWLIKSAPAGHEDQRGFHLEGENPKATRR